ncbi:cyclic GMP-AMP synthase [Talpa occidentalis]|uniref:cyclic GMP-AMP synthase n=1 Tax=Talpa occidentalis TaxID=50954 RepID=UPI00188E3AB2|nr:cyclic GMP-AMP synthase [Talpa occidentalis]
MDPRRGKVAQGASKTSKAGAAAPKTGAPGAKDAQAKPLGASGLKAQACGGAGESRPPQKKGARAPQTGRRVSAGDAGAKKGPLPSRGVESPGAPGTDQPDGQAVPAEGLEPPADLEPSLPAGGSRSKGSARSSLRKQRSLTRPPEVPPRGPLVPARSLGGREVTAGKLRSVLEKLKLNRQEISAAAEVVNRVVDHLLRRMQSRESEFKGVTRLSAGSYYEHVKISAPNEFDVMFTLEMPRIQLEEYCDSGTHYLVKFKRIPKGNPLSEFLEKEVLSASKMLSKFRTIIKEEIKNIPGTDITLERKKRGSPAVTLLIRNPEEISVDIILALESRSAWPACTGEGLPIKTWLGAKVRTSLRRQPFYLVPKHAKNENGFQEETWRLSFSNIEKDILNNHGQHKTCCESEGVKCCRKDCLKLMKYLLQQLKKKFENRRDLDKFCSYHVKTAFFILCTEYPKDDQWLSEKLEECFDRCVAYFLDCLNKENLQHYFIPSVNLFSQEQINRISKEFLSKQIEHESNNGFPVFDEF